MPSSSSFIVVGSLSSQATPLGGQLTSGVLDIVTTAPVEGENTFKLAGSVNGSVLETDPTELALPTSIVLNSILRASTNTSLNWLNDPEFLVHVLTSSAGLKGAPQHPSPV